LLLLDFESNASTSSAIRPQFKDCIDFNNSIKTFIIIKEKYV